MTKISFTFPGKIVKIYKKT